MPGEGHSHHPRGSLQSGPYARTRGTESGSLGAPAALYQTICDRYEVPIRAAALQFVVAHPAVVSVIPGPASMEEMTDNIRMTEHEIPPEFWADMKSEGLIGTGCPVPHD